MSDCNRKNIFGHPICNFEPRYDESREPVVKDLPGDASVCAVFFGRVVPTKASCIYVCDVCTRCGKVIERSKSAS